VRLLLVLMLMLLMLVLVLVLLMLLLMLLLRRLGAAAILGLTDPAAARVDASRGGPNSKGRGTQIVGKAGDLLIWHGWLQHAGSQRAAEATPYYPRLALLGSFRNTAMENSGPPVFYEPKPGAAGAVGPGSLRGVWEGQFREPPNHNELRYAIPPLEDLWHFWGDDVQACGGDEQVEAGTLNFDAPALVPGEAAAAAAASGAKL
jgi:hypothetical protein